MRNLDSSLLLIRFSEIGIKSSRTRRWLTKRLVRHIDYVLNLLLNYEYEIIQEYSRLYVRSNQIQEVERILISYIPGIKSTSIVYHCETNFEQMKTIVMNKFLNRLKENRTFAVQVKRVGKHDFTSVELAADLGAYILDKLQETNLQVDLTAPDYTLYLEVRRGDTYIFEEKKEGLGGLPEGCQGTVLVLNKGSKEDLSNVLQMYKRGANTIVCSLSSEDKTDSDILDKINFLVKLQMSIKNEKQLYFITEKENIPAQILNIYKKSDSQALVMSTKLFHTFSDNLPISIPIFVPHLVNEIDKKELSKIVTTDYRSLL